jgi:hypothetical protein
VFLGVAAFYQGNRNNEIGFTIVGRMIFAGCLALVIGLIFAAVSYPVAVVVYVIRGSK